MKNDNGAAVVVTIVALLLTVLWALGHRQLQAAVCPAPVYAAGHTIACDGHPVMAGGKR